jgi:hypothetical protein
MAEFLRSHHPECSLRVRKRILKEKESSSHLVEALAAGMSIGS